MFSNQKIIQHYARILFEYSVTRKDHEIFYQKVKKTSFLLKKNIILNQILYTSLLNSEKKIKIFKKIFYVFDVLLFKFMNLLIIKKRESLIEEIFLRYQEIYEKDQKKIVISVITSAFPLKTDVQNLIAKKIISNKKKFHIINKIDKSIIGGFLFRVGYKEWDFSIRKQLSRIKKIF
ncbi:ATP synthase F1 subunit delta [Blattabacterium cuenoti]|uniref:ATP synthase F1 subunit delta n=1 Tax=Blattabacterium cuenoti TaxID=1653831 RepID=UPI00163D03E4|nr:ATP synthase F1 subunit delta [Blattabacterium cuenoti]